MLKIDVRYYDKAHEEQFKGWPSHARIEALVHNGLEVDELELLTYSVFDEQRNADGWRNYADMRDRVQSRVQQFRDYLDLSQGTVAAKFSAAESYKPITEKVGVAASLVAANRIFDLHEADWTKVPESHAIKTLDFSYASTGVGYVEVEAKGTIVDDVNHKSPSVYQHKLSISKKKKEQRESGTNQANSLLGTIVAIPANQEQRAVCWIVDPPADAPDMDPEKYRLLSRMGFYLNGLQVISQSTMALALRNRLEAMRVVTDYRQLNGVPLVNARGKRFRIRGPFFRNKTLIGGRIVGRAFHLTGREFMYVGFDVEAYRIVSRQRFDEILTYKSEVTDGLAETRDTVAWLDEQDLGGQNPEELGAEWVPQRKRFRLGLKGKVRVGRSGHAVGILEPSEKKKGTPLRSQGNPKLDSNTSTAVVSQTPQGAQISSSDPALVGMKR